jgi:heterodisulfide reductase subunit B2
MYSSLIDLRDIGLQNHQETVESLLDKFGIIYDPTTKYSGQNGKILNPPEMPQVLKCC